MIPGVDRDWIEALHARSGAARWHVSVARLEAALEASLSAGLPGASGAEARRYLEGLHLDDLALACGCIDGDEDAWAWFVERHQPALTRAAHALGSPEARELSDSLYGELYGLEVRDGERRSLLRYFHGRSSLGTWLRAVLAQRWVDRTRQTRRFDSLEGRPEPVDGAATSPETVVQRPRFLALMRAAIRLALTRLAPRDHLRLTCYYADGMRLAHIGRALGEHEATTSRHLARTRTAIRQTVEAHLRDDAKLTEGEIEACFTAVADDPGDLDLDVLLAQGGAGKNRSRDRSTE